MLRLLVLSAIVVGSLVGAPSATATAPVATQVCYKAWTTGTKLGSHTVGNCTPWGGPTLCANRDAGLDPSAHVFILICVPD